MPIGATRTRPARAGPRRASSPCLARWKVTATSAWTAGPRGEPLDVGQLPEAIPGPRRVGRRRPRLGGDEDDGHETLPGRVGTARQEPGGHRAIAPLVARPGEDQDRAAPPAPPRDGEGPRRGGHRRPRAAPRPG